MYNVLWLLILLYVLTHAKVEWMLCLEIMAHSDRGTTSLWFKDSIQAYSSYSKSLFNYTFIPDNNCICCPIFKKLCNLIVNRILIHNLYKKEEILIAKCIK